MYIIKPSWLRHSGEQKDFEVYSCHVSQDGKRLATAGGDGHVRIWSTDSIYNGHVEGYSAPRQLCHMSHHLGTIHSVRFSPNNRYLASGADDRVICIYQLDSNPPSHATTFGTNEPPPIENWKTHKRLVGHDSDVQDLAWSYDNSILVSVGLDSKVVSSPLTTYFRRCSWSPDGNHIAAANAVNGPVSSVAIIERSRWDSQINLIGHEGPTEACMFSPRLFHTQNPAEKGASGSLVTVIASAGQDKTLSIWNTNTSRPVVIVQDVASKSISDLAWAPDGQTLFACSLDGNIVVVQFEVGELGWVATAEENDKALEKYGVARKGMGTAEDVDGLHLENHSKAGELRGAESRMGALMGDLPAAAAAAAAASKSDTAGTTNGTKSTKNGEAKNGDAVKNGETNGTSEPKSGKETPAAESADKAAERINELKSRVQVTKDGRKRVAPLLVSSSGTGLLSLPQSQLVGAKSKTAIQSETPQTVIDLSKPSHGLPKGGIAALLLGTKRKAVVLDGEEEDEPNKRLATGPVPIMADTVDGLEPATLTSPAQGLVPTPEFLRSAVVSPSVSFSQVRLAVPKIRSHIVRALEKGVLQGESTLEEASKIPENTILEAKNPARPREPSHITATKRGALLWQDYLPRAIILLTGNKHFWAAACEDGTLHTWTPAGRRLLNGIILESQPIILESRDHWLLCVTSVGMCHVFNIKTMSAAHPPVSLAPILDIAITSLSPDGPTAAPGVTSAHLNSLGTIVVTLSNGDGFYYSPTLYTWQRLSESWWALGSQYWNSNDSSLTALSSTAVGPSAPAKKPKSGGDDKPDISAGIIPHLERHTTTEFLVKGRAYTLQRLIKQLVAKDGFEGFESVVSVAHLENRMAGALALGAKEEFRLYLFMYAKRIGAEGLRSKVEELLNTLVGGVLQDSKDGGGKGRGWFDKGEVICGWERKELLKGVVLILGKFRDLQRTTVQYARILGLTAGNEEDEEDGEETNGVVDQMEE
ncbi:HIR complex subunit [Podospora pseudocomata]|uniref:Protein HIR n=1 Tax=Podospora pseudocomata TaxID=2093779 RepID=A0ABR0GG46_9PEZI|nr:HIR complex subunit [Podospora pseudocomata]